jgi:hypothetical protein
MAGAQWVPWFAFGCPVSIMLSAAVAGWHDHRQLTYWEAYTCGLLYWIPKPPEPMKRAHHAAVTLADRPRVG